MRCAERNANADLARALTHSVRDRAVQADDRENERHAGERAEQCQSEARRRERLADIVVANARTAGDEPRVHAVNRLTQHGLDVRRNAREANDIHRKHAHRHAVDLKLLRVSMPSRKLYVLGHTDHAGPRITPRRAALGGDGPDPHPDGVAVRRDATSQRATHDDLVGDVSPGLAWRQRRRVARTRLRRASSQEGDTTRPEIVRADPHQVESPGSDRPSTVGRIDDDGVAHLIARGRQHALGRRCHAGNLGEAAGDGLANRRGPFPGHPRREQDVERNEVARIETEWCALKRDERAREQSGTHEQRERERDFRDDERRPHSARCGAA